MTKREQYNLNFEKLKINGSYFRFGCSSYNALIHGSLQLSSLLDVLSNREPDGLLEEVNLALSGQCFEDIYRPDGSSIDKVEIFPPNAIVNDSFTISLIDLKELLEEWISFVEN